MSFFLAPVEGCGSQSQVTTPDFFCRTSRAGGRARPVQRGSRAADHLGVAHADGRSRPRRAYVRKRTQDGLGVKPIDHYGKVLLGRVLGGRWAYKALRPTRTIMNERRPYPTKILLVTYIISNQ